LCTYLTTLLVLLFAVEYIFFFFSSRRRHTRWPRDWSSDVCSSDLSASSARNRRSLLRASLADEAKPLELRVARERLRLFLAEDADGLDASGAVGGKNSGKETYRDEKKIGRASCRERV